MTGTRGQAPAQRLQRAITNIVAFLRFCSILMGKGAGFGKSAVRNKKEDSMTLTKEVHSLILLALAEDVRTGENTTLSTSGTANLFV